MMMVMFPPNWVASPTISCIYVCYWLRCCIGEDAFVPTCHLVLRHLLSLSGGVVWSEGSGAIWDGGGFTCAEWWWWWGWLCIHIHTYAVVMRRLIIVLVVSRGFLGGLLFTYFPSHIDIKPAVTTIYVCVALTLRALGLVVVD